MSELRGQKYASDLNPFRFSRNIKSVLAGHSAVKPMLCVVGLLAVLSGGDVARATTPPPQTKPAGHTKTGDHDLRLAKLPAPSSPTQAPCNGYGTAQYQPPPPPPPPGKICDGTICVSLATVSASIHQQLDCNVVGYAFFVGNALTGQNALFGAYGMARTALNPPAAAFTIDSRAEIGSASKTLTALAALRAMGTTVDKPAYTYFPWTTPAGSIVKNITTRRFLSMTSGVMQHDAGAGDDAALKMFFTQPIPNPNATPDCGGAGVTVQYPILATTSYCYSNANFGVMRDVLGRFGGSDNYIAQVNKNVFNPVGVSNRGCMASPTASFALGYSYGVNFPGTAFDEANVGDLRLICGAGGWWVSIRDYATVLVSLNSGDGKILSSCGFYDMVTNPSAKTPVGWDYTSDSTFTLDGQTHRFVEKNGETGAQTSLGEGATTTSVALYGGRDGCVASGHGAPIPGVAAALFINSNVRGSDSSGLFEDYLDASGPLTLSGTLVTGGGTGGAALGSVHHVLVSSTSSKDTNQVLQIIGSLGGKPETENITVNGQNTVTSQNQYDTITGIVSVSGPYPTVGVIFIGTDEFRADYVLYHALQAATTPD